LSALLATASAVPARIDAQSVDQLVVPRGFQVTVFADSVSECAASMAVGCERYGVRRFTEVPGRVHAVIDQNGDHKADRIVTMPAA
jgi:hypothetical protein